ncbi:MAG: lysylphosphatidylglycerol synthase transmembrane domain-containing protein [Candidatus Kryptoniota bacterium]
MSIEHESGPSSDSGSENGIQRPSSSASFSLRQSAGIALKILAASLIVFILWREFAGAKIGTVLSLLDRVGFVMIVVLIPPLFETVAETFGLAICVPGAFSLKRMLEVVPVRVGCDALLNSLPGGVVAGEALRPIWLRRACSVPIEESIAACLMAKINMAAAEGLFLAVVIVLVTFAGPWHGFAAVLSIKTFIPVIIVFMLVFAGVGYVYSGPRVTQLMSLLKRIRWSRLKDFLLRHESSVFRIDATILRFARQGRRVVFSSLAAFVVGWILLGFESFVILRILGQNVSVGQGFLMEGTASLLRIAFFFIPSGFGAVEAAYVSLIASFGAADPASVALAFIAIKRSQEVIWMAWGYTALLISRRWKSANSPARRIA